MWSSIVYRKLRFVFVLLLSAGFAASSLGVGLVPVPVFTDASISASVSSGTLANTFVYNYTVSNPATNTGDIWHIRVDVSQRGSCGTLCPSSGLTIPMGSHSIPFDEMLQRRRSLLPFGTSIVPFGQSLPFGWNGGFSRDGFVSFAKGTNGAKILPGSQLSDLQLITYTPPVIRDAELIADWVLVVENHDAVTDEELDRAAEIEQGLIVKTATLGPAPGVTFGSSQHWDLVQQNIQQAIDLNWITDPNLATQILQAFNSAFDAYKASDGTLAKSLLPTVIDLVEGATPAQRRQEIRDLLIIHVQLLLQNTRDTPIPFEPELTVAPLTANLNVGETYILTAQIVNLGDNRKPIADFQLDFHVRKGPHRGRSLYIKTDTNGEARFTFVGERLGTDQIVAEYTGAEITFTAEAEVTWDSGPDLVIAHLGPRLVITQAGDAIFVTEATANNGELKAASSSVTRYYLSPDPVFDISSAIVFGERQVNPLDPGQISGPVDQRFVVPSNLPQGTYHLTACADADATVAEADEGNNCSFTQINNFVSISVSMERTNLPPVCENAFPNIAELWPPNHKMVNIQILGITDPEGDTPKVTIKSIRQDEPVNGLGDGNTAPDAAGVGTSVAQLRAERSGILNGRVYTVGFEGQDSQGLTCTGSVQVGVPHDRGKGTPAINDGPLHDSTLP